MGFSNVSVLGIFVAAILSFGFDFGWHRAFEKRWMTDQNYRGKPALKPGPLAIVFLAYVVIAGMLAGLTAHIGPVTLTDALITSILVWAGFILTAMVVDHSYEARPRKLTAINAAHWFGVFVIMGIVIGLFG